VPSIKRLALATRSTEGSGATIEALYPGYRGLPVMAQQLVYDRFP
jgi:hypothetical protein